MWNGQASRIASNKKTSGDTATSGADQSYLQGWSNCARKNYIYITSMGMTGGIKCTNFCSKWKQKQSQQQNKNNINRTPPPTHTHIQNSIFCKYNLISNTVMLQLFSVN